MLVENCLLGSHCREHEESDKEDRREGSMGHACLRYALSAHLMIPGAVVIGAANCGNAGQTATKSSTLSTITHIRYYLAHYITYMR